MAGAATKITIVMATMIGLVAALPADASASTGVSSSAATAVAFGPIGGPTVMALVGGMVLLLAAAGLAVWATISQAGDRRTSALLATAHWRIDSAQRARAQGQPELARPHVEAAWTSVRRLDDRLGSRQFTQNPDAARAALAELRPALDELTAWLPRRRAQPLNLVLEESIAHSTKTPPESDRLYVWQGRFHWAKHGTPLDTNADGIHNPYGFEVREFVVDEHGNFYAGLHGHAWYLGERGRVAAAGILATVPGNPGLVLYMNTGWSGHFPDSDLGQLQRLVEELGLDLSQVVYGPNPDTSIHRPTGVTPNE